MSYRNYPVHLVGGRTCLDFLNTANWNADGTVGVERLEAVDDVSIWLDSAGLTCRAPKSDKELHETILGFRGALRRIVLAAVENTAPMEVDVAYLNRVTTQAGRQAPVNISEGAVSLTPHLPLTGAIALSAIALLTDRREISRVKKCPGGGCGWLFIDESANGRRQWCSMEMCGNREKARRHYAKKRRP